MGNQKFQVPKGCAKFCGNTTSTARGRHSRTKGRASLQRCHRPPPLCWQRAVVHYLNLCMDFLLFKEADLHTPHFRDLHTATTFTSRSSSGDGQLSLFVPNMNAPLCGWRRGHIHSMCKQSSVWYAFICFLHLMNLIWTLVPLERSSDLLPFVQDEIKSLSLQW